MHDQIIYSHFVKEIENFMYNKLFNIKKKLRFLTILKLIFLYNIKHDESFKILFCQTAISSLVFIILISEGIIFLHESFPVSFLLTAYYTATISGTLSKFRKYKKTHYRLSQCQMKYTENSLDQNLLVIVQFQDILKPYNLKQQL